MTHSRSAESAAQPTTIEVVDAIRRIIRAFRLSSRDIERSLGITGAQLFVLERLAERPAASLNELAQRTLTDQSSVSVVVQRLVKRGLVRRRRARADNRRLELALTSAGLALLQRSPVPMQVRLIEALSALSETKRARLALLLRQVIKSMGAEHEPASLIFDMEESSIAATPRSAAKRHR